MYCVKNFEKLVSCERGVSAIIFALVLVPLLFCIGVAIDYTQLNSNKAAMQEHLDAAVLAGTSQKDLSPEERAAVAQKYFFATLSEDIASYVTDLKIAPTADEDGLRADMVMVMPTRFMSFLGTSEMGQPLFAETNFSQRNRQLDMVFCIDATGSMQEEIDGVTNAAYNLQQNINAQLKADDKAEFEAMRVRVIFYRDFGSAFGPLNQPSPPRYEMAQYGDADEQAMHISPMSSSGQGFMNLPAQSGAFKNFLDAENASSPNGDDEPESGFICLNEALNTTFAKVGDPLASDPSKKISSITPLIAIWTDANARPINDARARTPSNQPGSYADLKAKWNDADILDQKNKLMVFFGNLDRACATLEEQDGGTAVASSGSTMSDVTGSVDDHNCPAGGTARWRESIGTWGLNDKVFNYSLQSATNNLAVQIANALSKHPTAVRMSK